MSDAGGHNRKSIADHKREGTFRSDRHADRMDERDWHTGGMPEPPQGMSPQQQWAWNSVVGGIRRDNLAELDAIALQGFVRWFAEWSSAMTDAEQTSGIFQERAIRRAATCWDRMAPLMARFGMTPGDRSKFKKSAPKGPSETNPIAALAAMANGGRS